MESTTLDSTRHKEFAEGLRELATFVESTPELSLPSFSDFNVYGYHTKQDAAFIAKTLGKCDKEYADTLFSLVKKFGIFKLKYVFFRDQVCEAVVVGKKVIPAEPEKIVPAKVIPATEEREVDVIEYRCQPLLSRGPSIVDAQLSELSAGSSLQLPEEASLEIPF